MADVDYEVTDGVAVITLNRPEVKNALNLDVLAGLEEAAVRADAEDEVGAVVVTGAGGSFSAGLDTSLFAGGFSPSVETIAEVFQAPLNAIEDIEKPVIAAIEGYCLGGGAQIALACHLRAFAPDAQFAIIERRWGLIPDMGGTYRLPRLVGLGVATELILSARRVDTEEARGMGLAEIALGAEDPLGDALEYAAKLAHGPGAVRRTPSLLRENLQRDRFHALKAEAETQMACLTGPDFAEAVGAAIELREPRFTGA